jgi:hypothetical protein
MNGIALPPEAKIPRTSKMGLGPEKITQPGTRPAIFGETMTFIFSPFHFLFKAAVAENALRFRSGAKNMMKRNARVNKHEAPLIDAEFLFRQPGPVQYV